MMGLGVCNDEREIYMVIIKRHLHGLMTLVVCFLIGSGVALASPSETKTPTQPVRNEPISDSPRDDKEKARDDAEKIAKKAVDKYNTGVKRMKKAKELMEKGDEKNARRFFEKAAKKYADAIDLRPDFPEALNNLGYSLRITGRYEEALKHYDRAIELDSLFVQAHEYRARAYLALDRVKDAKAAYVLLLRLEETEEAEALKDAIDAWVLAKADGRKISVEKGAAW